MRKILKIILLIVGIGIIVLGALILKTDIEILIVSAHSGNSVSMKRIADTVIIGALVAFTLEVVWDAFKVLITNNQKNLKKAILASIFVLALIIADFVLVGSSTYKIIILVLCIVDTVLAFAIKFIKEKQKPEKLETDIKPNNPDNLENPEN